MDPSDRLSDLLNDAQNLLNSIEEGDDDPPERVKRRVHQLRETLGLALIFSEELAEKCDAGSMVTLKNQGDGTGMVSFTVDFSSGDFERSDN